MSADSTRVHPVDRLAPLAFRLAPARNLVFRDGWGDDAGLGLLGDTALVGGLRAMLDLAWDPQQDMLDHRLRRVRFTSPLAEFLPAGARIASALVIEPPQGTDRLALILPAWNDHEPATRVELAKHLLEHGIGSIIPDAPYLGERRIHPPSKHAIATVADFARMGAGVVTEAAGLIETLGHTHLVGVSGYSMGGNLAALVAALARRAVPTAPLAASYSPGPVFCEGVLERTVAWRALGDGGRERLREALDRTSVLELHVPPSASSAIFVAGRRDGFVPIDLSRRLVEHWPGSELRTTGDGHATLLWRRRPMLAQAVADAFDRFSPPVA